MRYELGTGPDYFSNDNDQALETVPDVDEELPAQLQAFLQQPGKSDLK